MDVPAEYSGRSGGPFQRVIVGVDQHQGGRDAIALGTTLVARGGTVLRACVSIGEGALITEPAEDGTGDGEPLRISAPTLGRGLHELAIAERADLLVVGSRRDARPGRVLIGEASIDALNGAPGAIAIVPLGYAERPAALGEIGVAYDGSLESMDAIALARALAAEHGARVSAFEALTVSARRTADGVAGVDSLTVDIDTACRRIAALGDIEPHAAYGPPAVELALYSASVDLLIVGSRGYGPIGRLAHPSTSRLLARSACCPVLVLTRSAPSLPPDDPASLRAQTG